MLKQCAVCGAEFQAKRPTAKYCPGSRCRTRASRARKAGRVVALPTAAEPQNEASHLQASVARALSDADRLNTWFGRQAVALAARIEAGGDTGASVAALSKELRAVMAEALRDVKQAADPLDELRALRDRKRSAG